MKFHINWLNDLLDKRQNESYIAEKITAAGLEVESVIDGVFDVSVPPNRADCLGMIGLAREIAAIIGVAFKEPEIKLVVASLPDKDKIDVDVQDAVACPKYLSRIIKGVDNTVTTPRWMQERLLVADINLISPIVDITNYVLLEWGQPLHAFDLNKLDDGIVVRKAKATEELVLLNDTKVALSTDTLIVADNSKPLAIAGIKGGKDSGVATSTTDICIECAYFAPVGIRLSARKYGLKTDASYRFERCIDPHMQEKVMEHATALFLEIVGGKPGPVVRFAAEYALPTPVTLTLRLARVSKILGVDIPVATIIKILQALGMQVTRIADDNILQVNVPAFRTDITREIDLIEEIVRIYGFDNIPAQAPLTNLQFMPLPEAVVTEKQITDCLLNRGYNEAITYSFIDQQYAALFGHEINERLCLVNPISSEMGYMRNSLLPGLLQAIQYNHNRQQDRIRLFEIGLRYVEIDGNLQQIKTIAGVCYGSYYPENWANVKRAEDTFDIKGDVLALFALAHEIKDLTFVSLNDKENVMHPGQSMQIMLHGKQIGKIGALHPQLQQQLELPHKAYMFELDYAMLAQGQITVFNNFSKYPAVRRDIAILVDSAVSFLQIQQAINKQAGDVLAQSVLFDVYQGKGVPDGQKSMAFGLTLQHIERTLTDTEVNNVFANVLQSLQQEFAAVLR
mgnify:CR=1 FL=1